MTELQQLYLTYRKQCSEQGTTPLSYAKFIMEVLV